jgi:hypothetical protein
LKIASPVRSAVQVLSDIQSNNLDESALVSEAFAGFDLGTVQTGDTSTKKLIVTEEISECGAS